MNGLTTGLPIGQISTGRISPSTISIGRGLPGIGAKSSAARVGSAITISSKMPRVSKGLLAMVRNVSGSMELGHGVPKPAPRPAPKTPPKTKIDNAKTVQTCAMPADVGTLMPARSPFDRAHEQRDIAGLLVPSARKIGRVVKVTVQHSHARVYPAYYFANKEAGVTFEQSCDSLYEAQRRLDGVAGIGLRQAPTAAEQACAYLNRLKGDVGSSAARDMTRRRM